LKKAQDEIIQLKEIIEKEKSISSQVLQQSQRKDRDSLDLSIAVAATEPHVSQLMEDLETISREKEKLSIEKEIAERKCAVAISLAEKQKVDYFFRNFKTS
jgi:hypothetical protein